MPPRNDTINYKQRDKTAAPIGEKSRTPFLSTILGVILLVSGAGPFTSAAAASHPESFAARIQHQKVIPAESPKSPLRFAGLGDNGRPSVNKPEAQDLPEGLRERIREEIAQTQFTARSLGAPASGPDGPAYEMVNRPNNVRIIFTREGLRLETPEAPANAGHIDIALDSWGRIGSEATASPTQPIGRGARVDYRRGVLTEWYINEKRGVEQGVTLSAPPEGQGSGDIRLRWRVSGSQGSLMRQDDQALVFLDPDGRVRLRYTGLTAWDASGKTLPVEMRLADSSASAGHEQIIVLEVDDRGAAYPITIDPFFTQLQKISASDAALDNEFGYATAMSGDLAVVGAPGNNSGAGAAYIFERNQGGKDSWGQVTKITASDGAGGDGFGTSVAVSGHTVVVGAPDDDGMGSAYVFERNSGGSDTWGQVSKITASDGATGDEFGASVAVSGDTVVVGAPSDESNTGAAYIFERNENGQDSWGQITKITASDGAGGDNFGTSVAISIDSVVAGSPGDDDGGESSGSMYVFARNQGGADSWGQVRKMVADDDAAGDALGTSVVIKGDVAAAGAPGSNSATGSAYVFYRNQGGVDNWGQVRQLLALDGETGDEFGHSLGFNGDWIVVGAYLEDDVASGAGSIYVFDRNQGGADNWGQMIKIQAGDAAMDDQFGFSVAIGGDTLISGANLNDDGYSASGSAYLFGIPALTAGNWGEVRRTVSQSPGDDEYLGSSVAISGDLAVVGAYLDGDQGTDAGAAYILERNQGGIDQWDLVMKISGSDTTGGDWFGTSVDIHGDVVVIGSPNHNTYAGAAYVFYRNQGGADNWGQVAKLSPGDLQVGDAFGVSVTVSGDVIVVGTPSDNDDVDDQITDVGSAYIFYRNQDGADNWGLLKKIHSGDSDQDDNFGNAVSLSGDTLAVGAWGDDAVAVDAGAAYVFRRNEGGADNWGQAAKLTAADAATQDYFSSTAVSVSNDTIVVGASGKSSAAGAAYLFERNVGGADNWGQVTKLLPSDPSSSSYFGVSVSISGDTILVGCDGIDNNRGAAYVFQRNYETADEWGLIKKLVASERADQDFFGRAVAVDGNKAVMGTPGDDELAASNCGSAFFFHVDVAGLTLTMSDVEDPVILEQSGNTTITYNLTVYNNGPSAASYVALTNTLPDTGATFVSATPSQGSCEQSAGTVTCDLATLDNGSSATVAIVVEPTQTGWFENSAQVISASTDPDYSDNTASETTRVVVYTDLAVSQTDSTDPIRVGDTYTYTVTVDNNGPENAYNVVVTDTLPSQVSYDSANPSQGSCVEDSGTVTCTFGQINNGADAYVDIQVSADQDGQAQNQATVSAAHVVDETPGNDTTQLTTQIDPVADLGVTKTESADPVYALTNLTYTIQVSNAGPSTATEVTVTDTLDASLTYVSATPSQGDCNHEAGVVTCDLGSVNQGGTPTIELVVRPAQPPGEDANYTVDNTAQVSSAAYDGNSANDSDTESTTVNRAVALVDLSITKTDGADPVLVDSNITYTITVANGGPDDAEDVTVSDVLPQGLSYVSAEATQGTCGEAGGTVTCQVGTLLNGNNSVITLVVTATQVGQIENTATVDTSSSDTASGNDSASETTDVQAPQADLAVSVVDDPDPVQISASLTYTVTIDNLGPQDAEDVTLADTLPDHCVFVSATPTQGTCFEDSGVVTCDLETLANTAQAVVTIQVTPQASGNLSNNAAVDATTADPDGSNNSVVTYTSADSDDDLITMITGIILAIKKRQQQQDPLP